MMKSLLASFTLFSLFLFACGAESGPSSDRTNTRLLIENKRDATLEANAVSALCIAPQPVTGPAGYARVPVLFSDDFQDPDLANRYSIVSNSDLSTSSVSNGQLVVDTGDLPGGISVERLTTTEQFPIQGFALDVLITVSPLSTGNYSALLGIPEMKYFERFEDPAWESMIRETTLEDTYFGLQRTEIVQFDPPSEMTAKFISIDESCGYTLFVDCQVYEPAGSTESFDFQPDVTYHLRITYSTQTQIATFSIPGVFSWQSGLPTDCGTTWESLCGYAYFSSGAFRVSMQVAAIALSWAPFLDLEYVGPSRGVVSYDNLRLVATDYFEVSLPALYKDGTLYAPVFNGPTGEPITGAYWLESATANPGFVFAPTTHLPFKGQVSINAFLVSDLLGRKYTYYSPISEADFLVYLGQYSWLNLDVFVPNILIANGPGVNYTWNLAPGVPPTPSSTVAQMEALYQAILASPIAGVLTAELKWLEKAIADLDAAEQAALNGQTDLAEDYLDQAKSDIENLIKKMTTDLGKKIPSEFADWLSQAQSIEVNLGCL